MVPEPVSLLLDSVSLDELLADCVPTNSPKVTEVSHAVALWPAPVVKPAPPAAPAIAAALVRGTPIPAELSASGTGQLTRSDLARELLQLHDSPAMQALLHELCKKQLTLAEFCERVKSSFGGMLLQGAVANLQRTLERRTAMVAAISQAGSPMGVEDGEEKLLLVRVALQLVEHLFETRSHTRAE